MFMIWMAAGMAVSMIAGTQMHQEYRSRTRDRRARSAALATVNAVRAEFMLPPITALVAGDVQSAADCAISRSIREGTDRLRVWTAGSITVQDGETKKMWMPNLDTGTFVHNFDHGMYPDLVRS